MRGIFNYHDMEEKKLCVLRILSHKGGIRMIEPDTIKLLRECDAGIRMGVKSIDDVLGHIKSAGLRRLLDTCRDKHDELDEELQRLLNKYGDEGKEPSFMAEKMAEMKTGIKLGLDDTDNTIADLMTDGCNMGVKSLSKYLNQYAAADEKSKDIAKKLIAIESQLVEDLRDYL